MSPVSAWLLPKGPHEAPQARSVLECRCMILAVCTCRSASAERRNLTRRQTLLQSIATLTWFCGCLSRFPLSTRVRPCVCTLLCLLSAFGRPTASNSEESAPAKAEKGLPLQVRLECAEPEGARRQQRRQRWNPNTQTNPRSEHANGPTARGWTQHAGFACEAIGQAVHEPTSSASPLRARWCAHAPPLSERFGPV